MSPVHSGTILKMDFGLALLTFKQYFSNFVYGDLKNVIYKGLLIGIENANTSKSRKKLQPLSSNISNSRYPESKLLIFSTIDLDPYIRATSVASQSPVPRIYI